MKVPLGINSVDHVKNIARAILAANSIVKPSPGVIGKAAVIGTGTVSVPQFPAVVAIPATTGIKLWQDAFKIAPFLGGSDLIVELPYSPRAYARTLDLRASVVEVPGTSALIAVVKPFAVSTVPTIAPKSLEDYLYTEMVAAGGYIAPRFDPAKGLDFIQCTLSTAFELAALLAEGGSGYGT
jgi:hypothetical protein